LGTGDVPVPSKIETPVSRKASLPALSWEVMVVVLS
jgi:hypothetical protein